MSRPWKLRDLKAIAALDSGAMREYLEDPDWRWEDFAPVIDGDGNTGKVVMLSSWLFVHNRDQLSQRTAILHKFVDTEPLEPSHTHQADLGFRRILLGWYVEEVVAPDGARYCRKWRAGDSGVVPSWYDHKIIDFDPRGTYSIWLRGPTRNDVRWTFPDGSVKVMRPDELE